MCRSLDAIGRRPFTQVSKNGSPYYILPGLDCCKQVLAPLFGMLDIRAIISPGSRIGNSTYTAGFRIPFNLLAITLGEPSDGNGLVWRIRRVAKRVYRYDGNLISQPGTSENARMHE